MRAKGRAGGGDLPAGSAASCRRRLARCMGSPQRSQKLACFVAAFAERPDRVKRSRDNGERCPYDDRELPIGRIRVFGGCSWRPLTAGRHGNDQLLLPTTVVGSYPQPDWLIDRERLNHNKRAARCARPTCGASPSDLLAAGAGRRDAPRHPRHGAGGHRHHHRRRDPAGKLLQPFRDGAGRHRFREARPRSSGAATAPPSCRGSSAASAAAGRSRCATCSSCVATPTGRSRSPCPARSPWRSRRRTNSMPMMPTWRWTTPQAVNEEARDLKAAGADVIQLDEPWMQERPEAARRYGVAGAQPRAGRHRRPDGRALLLRLRLRGAADKPGGYHVLAAARRNASRSRSRSRRRSRNSISACWRTCRARRSCSA